MRLQSDNECCDPSRDNDDDPRQTGEVYAIYIHPNWWRRGVGCTLLLAANQHLRQQGYSQVTLWTLRDNSSAHAFYEKAGLTVDGATKVTERGGEMSVEVRYRQGAGLNFIWRLTRFMIHSAFVNPATRFLTCQPIQHAIV